MNLSEIAARYNIPIAALRYRINEKGLSMREALSRPLDPGHVRGPSTIKQRARAAGVAEATIRRRLALGMALDDALKLPPQRGWKVKLEARP